jgi:large subunit ribosomal protein L29
MTKNKVKAADLKSLSAQELNEKKNQLEKELHELRHKKIVGQLEKPHQFKAARKQIARILTIQNQTSGKK